jgi:hypothetical protein
MITKKKYSGIIVSVILFLCSFSAKAVATQKLAQINDKDGFTNVRSGQGKDFEVIATISEGDFFYCEWSNAEWIHVIRLNYTLDEKTREGYMHRSRIQLIEQLPDSAKRVIIRDIFKKQLKLAIAFNASCSEKNSKTYDTDRQNLETFAEEKYLPVLGVFADHFCKTSDTALLQLFFKTLWANQGSASEIPAWEIGRCFVCNADLLIGQITSLKNKEEKKLLYDDIDFGLQNLYADDNGNCNSNNPEYSKLKKKLDTLLK